MIHSVLHTHLVLLITNRLFFQTLFGFFDTTRLYTNPVYCRGQ